MKSNLLLIAEGNASEAIKAYNDEIHTSNRVDNISEDEIYGAIDSGEFNLYMELLALEQHEELSCKVA